ncbi:sugar ABC transporter ATP-binding protein [Sinirhodobacter populi]|uniref:Sugar ABC transporter ATP-binding protein n=2 Tax=Paenirhodobacter populi TaxID=2306993 RepID=A0A443JLK6_9RHOB|nr:sugar ABC transporter ATP-binding protein [Sinirhodobacter populi]
MPGRFPRSHGRGLAGRKKNWPVRFPGFGFRFAATAGSLETITFAYSYISNEAAPIRGALAWFRRFGTRGPCKLGLSAFRRGMMSFSSTTDHRPGPPPGAVDSLLEVRNLSKSYGPIRVISDVSFDVPRRSVVTLVGENGAGKSTIFNILSGLTAQDSGTVRLDGQDFTPGSHRKAVARGITRVFQEQSLVQNVPVYENLLLGEEARFTRFGQWIDRNAMIRAARQIIEEAGLDVDVRRKTGDYDFSTRQSIEIARACLTPTILRGVAEPLVLLDEPTSALDRRDEEAFFTLVNKIRRYGSLLFVSHRLTEVLDISDVIYVLKDGAMVTRVTPDETDEHRLHGFMVGRERAADYYYENRQQPPGTAAPAIRAEGVQVLPDGPKVTLEVRPGEILGIGGLLDSGKSRLGKAIAGVIRPLAGRVAIGDGPLRHPEIGHSTRKGLGYIPAERLTEGIIAGFPTAWNFSTGSGGDLFSNRFGLWRGRKERSATLAHIDALAIRSATPDLTMARLSGGNQQKVVLARWLERKPDVLILDNPTRGVDAGAKQEIYRVLRDLTDQGVAIILITDELLELIGLSNRILILQHGGVVAEVPAPPDAKPEEQRLVALMLSGPGRPGAASPPSPAPAADVPAEAKPAILEAAQ